MFVSATLEIVRYSNVEDGVAIGVREDVNKIVLRFHFLAPSSRAERSGVEGSRCIIENLPLVAPRPFDQPNRQLLVARRDPSTALGMTGVVRHRYFTESAGTIFTLSSATRVVGLLDSPPMLRVTDVSPIFPRTSSPLINFPKAVYL